MDHNRRGRRNRDADLEASPAPDADAVVQKFHPTNGRLSGYLGLICAAGVLVLTGFSWESPSAPAVGVGALLGALVVWVVLLRPALWVTQQDLVLRNLLHTIRIPLRSITGLSIGQVLAVDVDRKRYLSPVVGYTARQMFAAKHNSPKSRGRTAQNTYQVFVEERINHLVEERRALAGDPTEPEVRRTLAWPELVVFAVLAATLLILILW